MSTRTSQSKNINPENINPENINPENINLAADSAQTAPLLIHAETFRQKLKLCSNHQQSLTQTIRAARAHILSTAQQKLQRDIFQGDQCARALADAHDVLLTQLFLFLRQEIFPEANPTKDEQITLLAIGGYGARRLAPFSDIDLLFLMPAKPTSQSKKSVEYMLKLLWDAGLKIGYSVRDVKNTTLHVKTDMVFCTTMLDARLLAGDDDLFQLWLKHFKRARRAIKPKNFVKAKLVERDIRHERTGRLRYLVEPDIKNGKGGLRDLQTLWWLAKFCSDALTENQLLDAELFPPQAYQQLQQCEAKLWDVRCHLHFMCNLAVERLSFQLQPALAERLNFKGDGDLSANEQFMKSYFLTAKQVGDLTRILCAILEERQAKLRPRLSRILQRLLKSKDKKAETQLNALDNGFLIEGGRLKISHPTLFLEKPLSMLSLFHLAAQHDLNFHPEALHAIRTALEYTDPKICLDPQANRLFLEILTSRKNPERILRVMNETGLLGWFIPDFGRIVAQMQFNMYHHYTVDEHLLHAIGQLAMIERNGSDDIKRARKILAKIDKMPPLRDVLYIALFTHDIAKGRGGDHSQLGSVVARKLARRLGLNQKNTETVAWLVSNHLLMSDTAQKRDIADPKTIQNFVREVKSVERLRLLFLLTIADIRAVGPNIWNGWKAQILETLYDLALAELKTPSKVKISQIARERRSKLAAALNSWSQNAKRDYVKLHSDAYWNHVDFQTQKRHAKLWKQWQEKTPLIFDVKDIKTSAVSEITLIAQDHPGLFSRIVGAFAISGLYITDAKIFTTHNGLAFDTFWAQTDKATPIADLPQRKRLQHSIEKVLAGDVLPHDEISKKQKFTPRKKTIFNITPKIQFDNNASDDYSVIEVDCLDSPYLLHALAHQIFRHGLFLSSARIATFGERAVDVFYVKDSTNQKITNLEKQEKIRRALEQVCQNL